MSKRFIFFTLIFICSTCHIECLVVANDLIYHGKLSHGESARVKISLVNESEAIEQVDFKLSDYSCNCQGQHFFDSPGTQVRSNSSWIQLNTTREVLQPKEKADFYFTIKVPKDPQLNGSYWSVLLIEPANVVQTLKSEQNSLQIQVKVRYAFHIVSDIGKGKPTLKILNKEFKEIDGKPKFVVDVSNTGMWYLNPKMTLKLFNSQGKLETTLDQGKERLYPGSSQRYLFDIKEPKEKQYKAFLLLDNGDNNLFGDSFKLSVP